MEAVLHQYSLLSYNWAQPHNTADLSILTLFLMGFIDNDHYT